MTAPLLTLLARSKRVRGELAKFGAVGFISLGVDFAIFNAILIAAPHKPLTAKIVSTLFSATNAYVLNRHWSFKGRTRSMVKVHHELALFALLNAIGLLIALGCLGVSHYALDLHSRLADNIAANGFGLVLGTAFRFWSYRRFIWTAPAETVVPHDLAAAAALVTQDTPG